MSAGPSERIGMYGLLSHPIRGWGQITPTAHRVVSSTFLIVQILVHTHFNIVSWLLALEATEQVSETVAQMAVICK
jgi:hypothetical protein